MFRTVRTSISKILLLALVVALTATASLIQTGAAEAASQTVTFKDASLEKAVRERLEKPTGDITEADMEKLEYLVIENIKITSLEGLEHAVNMKGFAAWGAELADIGPLRSLKNLRELFLDNNNITSLEPLSQLTNLEAIFASGNRIQDLSPLKNLKKLGTLAVSDNQISDIGVLEHLNSLGTEFFSAIEGGTGGGMLELDGNNISDISVLTKLPSIWSIDLSENNLDLSKDSKAMTTINLLIAAGSEVSYDSQKNGSKAEKPDEKPIEKPSEKPTDAPAFTDIANHWAKETIVWAKENGITSGFPDGTFKPDAIVTEEQFLKMLLSVIGIESEPSDPSWSDAFYRFAAENDYPAKGIKDPKAKGLPINRLSVAEIIAKADGSDATGNDAIQYLLDSGYSKGKTSATVEGYAGLDQMTRAEAVQFIKNVLEAEPDSM